MTDHEPMDLDGGVADLWDIPPSERRLEADRADERATLVDTGQGRMDALEALLRRHAGPIWRFAGAIALDREEATEITIDVWTHVVTETAAVQQATVPFRWELLRRTHRIATSQTTDTIDLTDQGAGAPFDGRDPSLLSVGFTLLDEPARSAIWLTEIERVPDRDAARLLDLATVSSVTHMVDSAVDLLARTIRAQVEASRGRCASTVDRFSDYLDGTLIASDVDVLHRHLRACEACSHRLDALEDPGGILYERMTEPPGDLTQLLLEQLAEPLRIARYG